MKAWVLYDSVYGNTEKIAQAIAAALGSPEDVTVFRVNSQPPAFPAKLDLLVRRFTDP